jgi:hypothetical protein
MPKKIKIIRKERVSFKKIIGEIIKLNSKLLNPLTDYELATGALIKFFNDSAVYRESHSEICDYVAELWGEQHVKAFLSIIYINGEKLIDA